MLPEYLFLPDNPKKIPTVILRPLFLFLPIATFSLRHLRTRIQVKHGEDIIITITIIPDIIPAAVAIGEEAVIGEIPIQTDVHLEVLVEIGSLPMEEVLQPDVLLM